MIGNRPQDVEKFLRKSLTKLKLDYADLYLIHFPVGMIGKHDDDVFPLDERGNFVLDMKTDLIALWKVTSSMSRMSRCRRSPRFIDFLETQAMEEMVDKGLAKSIGVSNFSSEQIERIVRSARIKPANLQVEMHAQFQQKKLREVCKRHGITVCAYAPLGSPGRGSFM